MICITFFFGGGGDIDDSENILTNKIISKFDKSIEDFFYFLPLTFGYF